jgi:hypothetical protein
MAAVTIAAVAGVTAIFFNVPVPASAIQENYVQQELDYFSEIAFAPPE